MAIRPSLELSAPWGRQYVKTRRKTNKMLLTRVSCVGTSVLVDFGGSVAAVQLGFVVWTAASVGLVFVENIFLLMAGRALVGAGAGMALAGGLVYASQMAKFRGFAVLAAFVGGVCGKMAGRGVLGFLEKNATEKWQIKAPLVLQAIWAALVALLGFLFPEYPPWLQWRGFLERANETRYALAPRAFPENGRPCSWKHLLECHKLSLLRAVLCQIWIHLTGVSAMVFCLPLLLPLFQRGGYGDVAFFAVHGLMAGAAVLASPISQWGSRRFFLMYGYGLLGGSFSALFGLLMHFGQASNGEILNVVLPPEIASWGLAVLFFVFTVDALYVSPLAAQYTVDVLPREVYSKGICISMAFSWLFHGASMFGVPLVFSVLQEWAFLVLGLSCFAGVLLLAIFPCNKEEEVWETGIPTPVAVPLKPKTSHHALEVPEDPPLVFTKRSSEFPTFGKNVAKLLPAHQKLLEASDPIRSKELPLVTARQFAENESSSAQSTVVLQTAKAQQSVKLQLGSHLNGLWSASEVEFTRLEEPGLDRGGLKEEFEAPGLLGGAKQPVALFGRRLERRGLLNANTAST